MSRQFTTQPIPKVTEVDVQRIVRRDFPPQAVAKVLSLLEQCRVMEADRTRLAILKLANGDLDELVHFLA